MLLLLLLLLLLLFSFLRAAYAPALLEPVELSWVQGLKFHKVLRHVGDFVVVVVAAAVVVVVVVL